VGIQQQYLLSPPIQTIQQCNAIPFGKWTDIISTIHMTGFIDYNNLQLNEDASCHEPDTPGLVSRMNRDGHVWHDTLWASSRELSLGKCRYYLMHHWLFSASAGAPVLEGGKLGNPTCFCNGDNTPATIKQLLGSQSYKTLGVNHTLA
jgi:hypothetical protein